MKSIFLVLLLTLLYACAPNWSWQHPQGLAKESLDKDIEYCKKQSAQTVADTWIGIPWGQEYWEERDDEFRACMHGRGWVQVPENQNQKPDPTGN